MSVSGELTVRKCDVRAIRRVTFGEYFLALSARGCGHKNQMGELI